MRKLTIASILAVILLSTPLFAVTELYNESTYQNFREKRRVNTNVAFQTTDSALVAAPCKITRIVAKATASPSSFILYDDASSATGTVLEDVSLSTANDTYEWTAPTGGYIKATNGVYLDTTSSDVRIYYES